MRVTILETQTVAEVEDSYGLRLIEQGAAVAAPAAPAAPKRTAKKEQAADGAGR